MVFVDELAADSPLARDFRERTLVIVLPLLNPDGVVEGNWRGNINGQDLNRDWGPFTQSETRAVRDLLERELDDDGRRLRSEEHTSELQSLMRISYAVFCLKKKKEKIYRVTTQSWNTNHKSETSQ